MGSRNSFFKYEFYGKNKNNPHLYEQVNYLSCKIQNISTPAAVSDKNHLRMAFLSAVTVCYLNNANSKDRSW